MAVLKKIKFGSTTTPIAKTVVQGKPEGVISVTNTSGFDNDDSQEKDYSYDIDVRVDDATIVKDGETNKVLKVGTVPATQVSVDNSDAGITATTAQAALKELKEEIDNVGGAAKSYTIIEETKSLPANVAHRYKLQQTIGEGATAQVTEVGENIDIYKDSSLKSVELDDQELVFTYILDTGAEKVVRVDVSKFLVESEFKDGLAVNNGEVSAKLGQGLEFGGESSENQSIKVKIDSTSEQDGQATPADFLTVGANGVKVQGIKAEITRQIQALDNTDTASTGQVVTAVSTADGIASPTKANLAGITLGGFTQNADATGAIADTDTLGDALNKLENAIDAAAEAAEDAHTVVEHASGNTHVTVAGAENANGGMTYTVSETNIANANDLADEISRAQSAETAIDTAVGLTKASGSETRSFTPTTNYGGTGTSAATSVIDNMQKLDTQLKTVSDSLAGIQYSVSGTELTFYGMTEHA